MAETDWRAEDSAKPWGPRVLTAHVFLNAMVKRHYLSTLPLCSLFIAFPLPFHSLSTAFPLPLLDFSLPFHCLSTILPPPFHGLL